MTTVSLYKATEAFQNLIITERRKTKEIHRKMETFTKETAVYCTLSLALKISFVFSL